LRNKDLAKSCLKSLFSPLGCSDDPMFDLWSARADVTRVWVPVEIGGAAGRPLRSRRHFGKGGKQQVPPLRRRRRSGFGRNDNVLLEATT
jgi:hypothetical protein